MLHTKSSPVARRGKSASDDLEQELPYRRVLHPWRIAGFCLASIVLLGAAFGAGTLVRSADAQAISNINATVPITAQVEQRVIDEGINLRGTVIRGHTSTISATGGTEGLPIVTDVGVKVGDTVEVGSYLGSVSGNSIFVMDERVPLYRDLKLNDTGADVEYLQTALIGMGYIGVSATGEVDDVTLEAIRSIYVAEGQTPPGETARDTTFEWQSFTQIKGNLGTVISTASVADQIDESTALASIQSDPNVVIARATVLEADRLPEGSEVIVTAGEEILEGLVKSLSEYRPEDANTGAPPGKDITIELPSEGQDLAPDQPVAVTTTSVETEQLAVPLIAIQQDASGAFVEVIDIEKATIENQPGAHRVDVEVTSQASGWAAISPAEKLPIGTEVRVP